MLNNKIMTVCVLCLIAGCSTISTKIHNPLPPSNIFEARAVSFHSSKQLAIEQSKKKAVARALGGADVYLKQVVVDRKLVEDTLHFEKRAKILDWRVEDVEYNHARHLWRATVWVRIIPQKNTANEELPPPGKALKQASVGVQKRNDRVKRFVPDPSSIEKYEASASAAITVVDTNNEFVVFNTGDGDSVKVGDEFIIYNIQGHRLCKVLITRIWDGSYYGVIHSDLDTETRLAQDVELR